MGFTHIGTTTKVHPAFTVVNSINIARPSTVVQYDLMLCAIAVIGSQVKNVPTGWKAVDIQNWPTVGHPDVFLETYVKVVGASEPSSYTWSLNAPTFLIIGCIDAWRGTYRTYPKVLLNHRHTAASFPEAGRANLITSPGLSASESEILIFRIGTGVQWGLTNLTNIAQLSNYNRRVMEFDAISTTPLFGEGSCIALTLQTRTLDNSDGVINQTNFAANHSHNARIGTTIVFRAENHAPIVSLIAPADGSSEDLNGSTPTFSWGTYDQDSGDKAMQSWALRRSTDGGSTWTYWNESLNAFQAGEVYNAGDRNSRTFPSGKWSNGVPYMWSVSVRDNEGLPSAYPAGYTVTGNAAPISSIEDPASDAGVIPYSKPFIFVGYSDADPIGAMRLRVFEEDIYTNEDFSPDGSEAWFDSGEIDLIAEGTFGRGLQVLNELVNGNYRFYTYVKDNQGVRSNWSTTTNPRVVTLAVPPTPTLAVTQQNTPSPRVKLDFSAGVHNLLTATQASGRPASADTYPSQSPLGWETEAGSGVLPVVGTAVLGSDDRRAIGFAPNTGPVTAAIRTLAGRGGVPVIAAKSYTAKAELKAATTGRTVRLYIRWYDLAGNVLSTSSAGSNITDATGSWTTATVTATSPASAAFAAVIVEALSVAANEFHYIDKAALYNGTAPGSWLPGGMVYSNLMDFETATLESGYGYWSWDPEDVLVLRSDVNKKYMACSLLCWFAVATGEEHYIVAPEVLDVGATDFPYRAIPLQDFTFSCWMLGNTGLSRSCAVEIGWFNKAGAFISFSRGNTVTVDSSGFKKLYVTATAPAEAYYAQMRLVFPSTIAANDIFYVDGFTYKRGSSNVDDLGPQQLLLPTIEYSDDGGATWGVVRGSTRLALNNDLAATIYDYEAPFNKVRSYRAKNVVDI